MFTHSVVSPITFWRKIHFISKNIKHSVVLATTRLESLCWHKCLNLSEKYQIQSMESEIFPYLFSRKFVCQKFPQEGSLTPFESWIRLLYAITIVVPTFWRIAFWNWTIEKSGFWSKKPSEKQPDTNSLFQSVRHNLQTRKGLILHLHFFRIRYYRRRNYLTSHPLTDKTISKQKSLVYMHLYCLV